MVTRPRNLTDDERNLCVQFILEGCDGGKPKRGRLLQAQQNFNISKSTVGRLWRDARKQQQQGLSIHLSSKKKGRTRDNNMQPDYDKIKSLPLHKRGSFRSMEVELKVSRATIGRWARAGLLKIHTNAIKPSLTADNKFLRLRSSLESLVFDKVMNKLCFSSMHNVVHIDEKWFYITKSKYRYYLAPDEEEPYRACKSKKFIGKIMFMCAVSRLLLRQDGTVLFDGKIGCFPFITEEVALRDSIHRKKGTKVNKAVDSITREVIKSCLLNQVILAIRQTWPQIASKEIFIQQDNAKPHINDSDPEFRIAATQHGFNIRLVQQPPNSPDTNINDLGFFNAIQSLQQQRVCKNVDDLVKAVKDAFHELPAMTLNKVFLTLQGCLTEIMKGQGHNNYKIPHMGKDSLIREGALPISLCFPLELARDCIQFLVENGQVRGIEHLVHRLCLNELTGLETEFASLELMEL